MSSFALSFLDFEIDFNLDFEVDCNFELPDADCDAEEVFMDLGDIAEYVAAMDPSSTFALYAEELLQELEPRSRSVTRGKNASPHLEVIDTMSPPSARSSDEQAVAVTYNIVNTFYGTVNNARHVENALFEDTPATQERQRCIPFIHTSDMSWTTSAPTPPESTSEDLPNAFILFGSTLVKAQCSTESLEISDDTMCDIVTDAWTSLSPGDRAKIEDDAE